MTDDIHLSRNSYSAVDYARVHVTAALSAARAAGADCMDTVAMTALDQVRDQLTTSLRLLEQLRRRARVSE